MKAIGKIDRGLGHEGYENGIIVMFTEQEGRLLYELIEATCWEHSYPPSLFGVEDIKIEKAFMRIRQFSSMQQAVNSFREYLDGFEKLSEEIDEI